MTETRPVQVHRHLGVREKNRGIVAQNHSREVLGDDRLRPTGRRFFRRKLEIDGNQSFLVRIACITALELSAGVGHTAQLLYVLPVTDLRFLLKLFSELPNRGR